MAFSEEHGIFLTRGCPQGSVLGLLIGNITYNYVIKGLTTSLQHVICYADDTIIINTGKSLKDVQLKVETASEKAASLLKRAGLLFNEAKT